MISYLALYTHVSMGGDLAPSLGAEKLFSDHFSELPFFRKKFPFTTQTFLMTFLVIDCISRIFSL